MFRTVYVRSTVADAQSVAADVANVAPTATIVVTPNYSGQPSGPVYTECEVDDAHQNDLEDNTFSAVADAAGGLPDGSGSLVLRQVRSTIMDRIAAVQALPEVSGAEKASKLAAAADLLGDIREDMESRAILFAAQTS